MISPRKIKHKRSEGLLSIEWSDAVVHNFPLKFLRDESPDAGNKGETILWRHYEPLHKGPDMPGKYEIKKIEMVGQYAVQITWKDGYDYGIYSWEILRRLGELLEFKKNLQ